MQHLKQYSTRTTPQSESIPGSNQTENNAGGFAWAVDDWKRLDRFLALGSEGGTYYVTEKKLTRDSADAVLRCISSDGPRTVRRIVEISEQGRAPKNDPALFALALASAHGNTDTRRLAFDALPRVARIGTHLFHFLAFREQFGGWGRGMRRAVRNWYDNMAGGRLAYQLVKYRQRDGWSHRDALRLAKPRPERGSQKDRLYAWATGHEADLDGIVEGFERAQLATTPEEWVSLVNKYSLPREALPTEALNYPDVWGALLENMPMTAMVRNLGVMTSCGLLKPMSRASQTVTSRLGDIERLRKARVHPISILAALNTYTKGHGARGDKSWNPVPNICDALDSAFYASFGNVEAAGKRTMLALDVSGSMMWGSIAGIPGLFPGTAAAAMSLVTANTEPDYYIMGFAHKFRPLAISHKQRLDDAVRTAYDGGFGGTDCALPMLHATQEGLDVDTFVVYTDSETWCGRTHPSQALVQYRQKSGIAARLIVVGMAGNRFSIADPNDAGMLDVVGFDTATPNVLSNFSAGRT